MALTARPRLVVLRALGLGDLCTALPALRGLARAFPSHRRLLLCPVPLAPLALATGAVDDVAGFDAKGGLEAGAGLPAAAREADVAVNLHGAGPGSSLLLERSRPRRLLAFRHPAVAATAGGPDWDDDEHDVARWCRLLAACGVPAEPGDLAIEADAGRAPPAAGGATLVHPGAASPARRWPAARYSAVAAAERAAGRPVVVTAGPGEHALASAVAAGAGLRAGAVVAPRGVMELAAVVAAAGRVVCGDTGVAHLATAVGIPSVVLFGPVPPSRWGPPADRPRHRALWAGGTGDPHAPRPDPGLLRITVEDVVAALSQTS